MAQPEIDAKIAKLPPDIREVVRRGQEVVEALPDDLSGEIVYTLPMFFAHIQTVLANADDIAKLGIDESTLDDTPKEITAGLKIVRPGNVEANMTASNGKRTLRFQVTDFEAEVTRLKNKEPVTEPVKVDSMLITIAQDKLHEISLTEFKLEPEVMIKPEFLGDLIKLPELPLSDLVMMVAGKGGLMAPILDSVVSMAKILGVEELPQGVWVDLGVDDVRLTVHQYTPTNYPENRAYSLLKWWQEKQEEKRAKAKKK